MTHWCPICKREGAFVDHWWPGGDHRYWHARETENGTAYCGPFRWHQLLRERTQPMNIADHLWHDHGKDLGSVPGLPIEAKAHGGYLKGTLYAAASAWHEDIHRHLTSGHSHEGEE